MINKLNESTILGYSLFLRITTIIGFLFILAGIFFKNCLTIKTGNFTEPVDLFILFSKPVDLFLFLVQFGVCIMLTSPLLGLMYLAGKSLIQKAYIYAILSISITLFIIFAIIMYLLFK